LFWVVTWHRVVLWAVQEVSSYRIVPDYAILTTLSDFHKSLSSSPRKVVPVLNILSTTHWRRMKEWVYRSTFSWPRHQLEVSGQLQAPAALPRGKAPGTPWIGWVDPRAGLDDLEKRKIWPYRDSNSNPSVVQPIASRYTDYAILIM
jgi:hypothetical protein